MKTYLPYILLLAIITLFSCNDDEKFTTEAGATIEFSKDTISFDTVFTTIGSSTKSFQVYNNNDKAIRIKNIRLASGGKSGFRLNVDGQYDVNYHDIDIMKKDSLFVFVEVTVNPQDDDSPILISDSLQFILENGRTRQVILNAYGQDIIILKDSVITEDVTLSSPRPYVIYDSLVVCNNATLHLSPGTTLCFHSGATLDVYGRIVAQGTLEQPITFRGDRTDKMFTYLPYDRIDGQWGGINLYSSSTDNVFDFVDIHGGYYGFICDSTGVEHTKLTLTNSQIHNVQRVCIWSTCCKLHIGNSQLTNSRLPCIHAIGGELECYHSTIAQFYPWNSSTSSCALTFTNAMADRPCPLRSFHFYNCIITGYDADEIGGEMYGYGDDSKSDSVAFNFQFRNCLVRTDTAGLSQHFIDCVVEHKDSTAFATANFKCIDTQNYVYDFQLDSLSRARGIGNPEYSIFYAKDKNGVTRKTDHPDAGCFEF